MYAGAYYHVIARGNRREEIFLDEEDRCFFLNAVSEVCAQTVWMVHAWMIMGDQTVASCGWLAASLKMRSTANVSQTLRRTEWKSLLKRPPRTLAEYIAKERS